MARVVQKYGGSSVADLERIRSVANRIKSCHEHGDELIVVVSARFGVTNELLERSRTISRSPDREATDALLYTGELETIASLALILNEIGVPAVPRNAYQVGILTCSSFGNARIKEIIGGDVEQCLTEGKIVVIAGFQGIDEQLRPTTLGRGGSDLTAIALAHRFQADRCEIFTDVDGVFSADPHIISAPYLIPNISHDSLLRLALSDNKVMQDRSVALAKKLGINFRIGSSINLEDGAGTEVRANWKCSECCVIGLTYKRALALFRGLSTTDTFCELLKFFSDRSIDLSFIKHNFCPVGDLFLDEICLESACLNCIHEDLSLKFGERYQSWDLVTNLDRIDIVGTGLEYSGWLPEVLDNVYNNNTIFRAEYGKNGLSFLVRSSNFEATMNELHEVVFR